MYHTYYLLGMQIKLYFIAFVLKNGSHLTVQQKAHLVVEGRNV